MSKLIKRIITRGFDDNFNIDNEALEHIFEFDDGTNINVSKMNAIEIASYAFENGDQDGYRIFNFITDSQMILNYATFLSVYQNLVRLAKKNDSSAISASDRQKILYTIRRLGGEEMLENILSEADSFDQRFMDVLMNKVETEFGLKGADITQ